MLIIRSPNYITNQVKLETFNTIQLAPLVANYTQLVAKHYLTDVFPYCNAIRELTKVTKCTRTTFIFKHVDYVISIIQNKKNRQRSPNREMYYD